MSAEARRQWRYIAWTRALHSRRHVRAFLLDLSNRLDVNEGARPMTCRLLDLLAGWQHPRRDP